MKKKKTDHMNQFEDKKKTNNTLTVVRIGVEIFLTLMKAIPWEEEALLLSAD